MKKIFFLIYIILNFSFAYSENIELKSREDVEIENIESQIKVLEDKIQTIKKLKNNKNKEPFLPILIFDYFCIFINNIIICTIFVV